MKYYFRDILSGKKQILLVSIIFIFAAIVILFFFAAKSNIYIVRNSMLSPEKIRSYEKIIRKSGFNVFGNIPFSKKMIINRKLEADNNTGGYIESVPLYASVDMTSGMIVADRKDIKGNKDQINNNKSEIRFLPVNELTLSKRILLERDSGKPLCVYDNYLFYVTDIFGNRDHNAEKRINKYIVDNNPVILGFAGDLAFDESANKYIKDNESYSSLEDVRSILSVPDIMSVNLEGVISNSSIKEPKSYTFKTPVKNIGILSGNSIDYTTNANNHSMDYGVQSLEDTISILDKNIIYHSGSGKNIDEAFKPALIKIKNTEFSYYSICDVPDESAGYKTMTNFSALQDRPGIAYFNENILTREFTGDKDKKRIVVVQYHTGDEFHQEPSMMTKKRIKQLIDLGADLVICHHPHVINGIEIYKDKFIAYSLGDFLFDITRDFGDEGVIVYLFFNDGKFRTWAFYPTYSYNGMVMTDDDRLIKTGKRFIGLTKKLQLSP
jgi:poly-gamma-glutamate capsule biosynthesis protein CapA/YwtB (metallophosphatase superfamily)